ncbi:MAG: von Willebrand factor type A domain-containing protein [Bacteroidales bacterium]|nr:von Willebrand factor type A domain-containing protein [Bacteroidales bacterium]
MKKLTSIAAVIAVLATCASCTKSFGFIDGYREAIYDNAQYAMDTDAEYGETDPQEPFDGDNFDQIVENDFIQTTKEPTSTFSIDADGAAYAYMRRSIKNDRLPNANSVRIEEFLNYFTFDYADPTGNETVAINAELGDCPWNADHKLLRLGLKGKPIPESDIPDANYILLIDVSGSMTGDDRIGLVKKGLCSMIDHMKPTDRIAIITYSGEVKKLLKSTPVSEAKKIKNAIKQLNTDGYTPGGAAMKMAYEEAVQNYIQGGNNRIIMCTDGDFNVGVTDTDALVDMVESYLDKGIYLSIMGFGTGNYEDARMESLSNHGNGTYTYIDCEQEMLKVFVDERSHFYSVANDTKCQITFTPEAVESYRLIGYENRVMNNEDFEDDTKDAGEIGAGQTITALYEIVPAEGFTAGASMASYDVRYKKALGGDSRPLNLNVTVPGQSAAASANMNLASGIAAYGLTLRNSQYKGSASYSMAKELVAASNNNQDKYRTELVELITKAQNIANKQ